MSTKTSKKVLIVEDNIEIRQFLEMLLDTLGLSHTSASNGREAMECLKKETCDVLLTDFQMPEIDGVALLQWCRSQQLHFPVIFISANAKLLPREQIALQDCCATLMNKPINLEALEKALSAAIDRNHHEDCVHSRREPV